MKTCEYVAHGEQTLAQLCASFSCLDERRASYRVATLTERGAPAAAPSASAMCFIERRTRSLLLPRAQEN